MVMNTKGSMRQKYVLMTAAYNEELHIEKTLRSMISQTLLPQRWVIVSDNSSDRTDEIIKQYADRYGFIRFLRVTRPKGRSFRSKVLALHEGATLLEGATYDFVGNIDGDISVGPEYFASLIACFEKNPELGIAGGFVHEETDGEFASRKVNSARNVPHAAQLVRRECYEDIHGYAVLEYGGEDWYAQLCARMNGWEVQAFPELNIFHHRHTGEGSHVLANHIRLGRLDYSFGSDPVFEILKCFGRLREKPYLLAALLRLGAFFWASLRGQPKSVPDDVAAFLRNEQKLRLASWFHLRRLKNLRVPAPPDARLN